MTVRHLGDLVIYAGAIAAALAALGVLARYAIVAPLKRWITDQIRPVHQEVTANHGASLKDAAMRTEQAVHELQRELRDHVRDHPGPAR